MKKQQFNWQPPLSLPFEIWRFLLSQGNFFASGRTFFRKNLPFFQGRLRFPKFVFASLSISLFLFGNIIDAQTIVPAGLGPMSATQPDRGTAVFTGNLLSTGGQNPTVKIVWGDEDGNEAGKSWDNTVVISTNQPVGSFSTTITIPNQEKIYYFRSVAENAGGTVVSRSVGILNPSAPVGVSDLRGQWTFDDDNFSYYSSPSDFVGLQLWLDASDLDSADSTWTDKSGNGNDATKNGSPTLVANAQNTHSVIRYTGNNADYHEWSDINDIQTIFWVVKANSSNRGFLLGDDNRHHFHHNNRNPPCFWHSIHSSSNVINGSLCVNGQSIDGLTTKMHSSLANLSIVSLRTTGSVQASRFSRDRTQNGRNWNGDLGELMIELAQISHNT